MRNPFTRFLLATSTILICVHVLLAQRLPTGAYQSNRERDIDILHYQAELEFDFEQHLVYGKATVRLTPLRNVESIRLDAIDLQISRVYLNNEQTIANFLMDEHTLEVLTSGKQSDTLTVILRYQCRPQAGMYFVRNPITPSTYVVTTYGEGGLHANWLPIYGDVNDKYSTEMIVTVPEPYVVISNGDLVSKESRAGGLTVYHWLQQQPHPGYLISLYVGEFERGDLAPAFGNIPVSFWVPKGMREQGAYAFRNTTRMIEHFSKLLDYRYPWVKYDQIAVPDYAIGAMEHTGVTGHRWSVLRNPDAPLDFDPTLDECISDWTAETTIAHELAHHWFGDNLTCRNLSYIWLNESFASYLMYLWDEASLGRDHFLYALDQAKRHYYEYVQREHVIRPLEYHYFDDPNTIYNTEHTYLKGAAVLHTLRTILGDDGFFRALSYYLHKHEFSNVESHDLKTALEEATGRNLQWFFDQWITGAGHPHFEVSYRYFADRKLVALSVKQIQPVVEGQGIFTLPVNIKLVTATREWQEEVWLESDDEAFFFPSEQEPLMVSFDGEGDLIAEVDFPKKITELAYQALHDAIPGRLWAMRQMAAQYPARAKTTATLSALLDTAAFWGIRAESALQLGIIRTPAAETAVAAALLQSNYLVRKAAVLALSRFGTATALQKLKSVVQSDSHQDVIAAAIVSLAQADPEQDPAFIKSQIGRSSWYDEITLACLKAFGILARPELLPEIKQHTADRYNQHIRAAALAAWEATRPADRELHQSLIALLASPVYTLQQEAITALGRLRVGEALAGLENLVQEDADANLVVAAHNSITQIRSVHGEGGE